MITEVSVAGVLREAVRAPYTNLVTRATGVQVREQIAAALTTPVRILVLDFRDIALLDCSCADEIVAKLAFADDGADRPLVALRGLREDQRDAIDHVLVRRGLTVMALDLDGLDVEAVGPFPADVLPLLAAALRGTGNAA